MTGAQSRSSLRAEKRPAEAPEARRCSTEELRLLFRGSRSSQRAESDLRTCKCMRSTRRGRVLGAGGCWGRAGVGGGCWGGVLRCVGVWAGVGSVSDHSEEKLRVQIETIEDGEDDCH
jgi:hypothetical protein